MSKSSPLVYGGVLAFARGLPILALLFASLRLEHDKFGQVAVLVTAAATAALFADSGTDSAATWLLSRTRTKGRAPVISALTYYRGLVAGGATAILVGTQIQVIDGDYALNLIIVVLCCLGNMLGARNSSNRIALRIDATGEKRSILLEKAGIGILFMVLTWMVPAEPQWILVGYGIATVVGGVVASRPLSRAEWSTSWSDVRRLASATLPFVATTMCSAVIWRLPTFVLGQTGQLAEAGFLALASYPIILVTSIPVLSAPLLLVKGGAHSSNPLATVRKGAFAGLVCACLIGGAALVAMALPLDSLIAPDVLSTILVLSASTIPLWINPLMVATLRVRKGLWIPITANFAGAVVGVMALVPFINSWHAEGAATAIVLAETVVLVLLLFILFFRKDVPGYVR